MTELQLLTVDAIAIGVLAGLLIMTNLLWTIAWLRRRRRKKPTPLSGVFSVFEERHGPIGRVIEPQEQKS